MKYYNKSNLIAKSLCIIFLAFSTYSCDEKDKANVLVSVVNGSNTVGQATIYLKIGTTINPNLPLTAYDRVQRADGTGQAYFSNLEPGDYFFFAKGYHQNKSVEGTATISLNAQSQYRTFKISINTN
ncbi:MAG: hypothetical protein HYZ44_10415 [Bacteroidetes bacterium]|nr:hypothetical protein [Bacteroidota bacterium]